MHSVYSAGNETGETSSQWSPPPCDSGGETDEEMEVDDMLFVRGFPFCAVGILIDYSAGL
jgi:hypothetical protein